jgi:RPA family protein
MHQKIVVSGWGQITQRKEVIGKIHDPLGLMAIAAGQAQEKHRFDVLKNIDGIMTVMTISRYYPDAAKQLAELIRPRPVSPIPPESVEIHPRT